MEKNLEKRMYFLTMYNISEIQKGIQCGHAQMEYSLENWKDEQFQDWAKNWKTWIVLNGGTSNNGGHLHLGKEGSMEQHKIALDENNVINATFLEPDLNDALSAIAFVVDERVFNRKDYPDFIQHLAQTGQTIKYDFTTEIELEYPKEYAKWVELMGGRSNVFLKEFLTKFRLA